MILFTPIIVRYSETRPYSHLGDNYGHLVIKATFFWQSGIMALHFLVKKTLVNTVTR